MKKRRRIIDFSLSLDFDAKKEKIPPCDYYCDTLYLLPYTTFVKLTSENKETASETSSTISSDTKVNGRLETLYCFFFYTGNFITDRLSTKVHAAPGGGSSLGYLFGGPGDGK
ncbi:DNA (cytosine-5)-methyltransferase CMT3 [Trifolium repens]|nr:DNA (cytosine-5)-methyltransferase CMT3 [Trifolium repens]